MPVTPLFTMVSRQREVAQHITDLVLNGNLSVAQREFLKVPLHERGAVGYMLCEINMYEGGLGKFRDFLQRVHDAEASATNMAENGDG